MSQPIHCPAIFKVFLRSLSLQASWNPQRMQNLGLVFTLIPWLRCQNAPAGEIRSFCRRHYSFFNTNPYMANYLLGGLLRLEKEYAADPKADPGTVKRFKDSLGRALASLGDQLFWLGLQPSLMLVAAVFVMLDWWLAALALLIAFGVLELAFRFHSLKHGHDLGMDIVDLLGSPVWHKAIKWAGRCGSIATGVMVALAVHPASGGMRTEGWVLFVFPLIALLSMVLRRHMPGESIMLLLVPLALLLAYL